ncbi:MAG: hypothetical protein IJ977_05820 [Fibrobacter sp.]|nr:hypothetical protein [Fibrobacter sp.]
MTAIIVKAATRAGFPARGNVNSRKEEKSFILHNPLWLVFVPLGYGQVKFFCPSMYKTLFWCKKSLPPVHFFHFWGFDRLFFGL